MERLSGGTAGERPRGDVRCTLAAGPAARAPGFAHPHVVFPPGEPSAAPPPRNVAHCALVRLADRSVHLLRGFRAPWTAERLAAVADALAFVDRGRPSAPTLRKLAHDLGDPALAWRDAPLDRVDDAAWDVRRTAIAYAARDGVAARWTPARVRDEAAAREGAWRAALHADVARFTDALDRDALAAARDHGRACTSVYTFAAYAPQPAWRQQFLRTFPLLADLAIAAPEGSAGAFVRDAVDAGRPLLRLLAVRWGVAASAVRALAGPDAMHAGERWRRTPHQLARIVDAIRPEDRPRDAASWQRFDAAVDAVERIFRCPAPSSPVTLGWLRRAARRGFAACTDEGELAGTAMADVDRMRAMLVRHVARAACGEARPGDDTPHVLAGAAADRLLASLSARRLAATARAYVVAQRAHCRTLDAELRRAGGGRFWPMLPEPLSAAGGALVVVPLVTLAALREEGVAQRLCIDGGSELVALAKACASGRAYVLSIRDAATGQRHATAEVSRTRRLVVGKAALRVVQHEGARNAPPSRACEAALHNALAWANSDAGAVHLAEGDRRQRHAEDREGADLNAEGGYEALAETLGEDALLRLAGEVGAYLRSASSTKALRPG